MSTIIECPYCGRQEVIGYGSILRHFDTRLLDPNYLRALNVKGEYHNWICRLCGNTFIRSNVICSCGQRGTVVQSREPRPKFICARCGRKETLDVWSEGNYATR